LELRIQDIAAAAANRATFQRGVEYYGQRRVSKLKIEQDIEHGGTKLTADVRGSTYSYEVEISLSDKGEISEGWCDCPAFYQYDGCCKHIVAVLMNHHYLRMSTDKQADKTAPPSVTDSFASRMLSVYSKQRLSEAMGSAIAKKVRLEPTLEYDYRGNVILSLSVGHDRMYIVKDLGRFYDDMRGGNTAEYGAKLTLTHAEGAFETVSQSLLQFFMNKYREFRNFHAIYGAPPAHSGKRGLVLSPAAFDEFFNIYVGQTVQLKMTFNTEPTVIFIDENPRLEINILNLGGKAFSVSMGKSPIVYFGEKHEYIMEKGRFYRCDEAFTAATRAFLFALSEKGEELVIINEDMCTFCTDVLATVSDYAVINAEDCDLSLYEPSPLTARLYLDMPMPALITASLRFRYGELEIGALDEATTPGVQRDVKREYIARAITEKYIGKYDIAQKLMYVDDEDKMYLLLSEGIAEISSVAQVYTTDSLKNVKIKKPPVVSVGVRLSGNLLDLSFDTGDFPQAELLNLLESYKQHKKYHKLRDGTFINLENSAFAAVSEIVDGLDLKKGDIVKGLASVHKYRAMYIDNIIRDSELLKSERDIGFKAMLRDIKDVDDADIQPPQELKGILRNYQKKGFRWLKTMSRYGFGGILADDMGLGKTIEAIAFMQSLKDEAQIKMPSIVICPASLVLNWESEIDKFSPRLKPLSIIGTAPQRAALAEKIPEYDVVLTSYELLKRDVGLYESIKFDCEILDEAQFIKNSNTQNAKAVKSIDSLNRFALTGTPVENSLAELWSVFDFLMPGYLYSHHKFREEYELPVMKAGDEQASARLRQLTAPFILRRLKSSVLKELPPKTETVLYTNLEGEQKKLYLAALTSIKTELERQFKTTDPSRNKIIVLSMLTRLRQLCCDPSLYFEDYRGESAKLELCMELLESSTGGGHKVLLFSQFTSMLSIIADHLREAGISYYVLRGSTSKQERARLINSFNIDDTQVFLISLRAGGTGLNLTAADIVIHYDPWWNVSVQNQATDRAHRIGQRNSVQVYKLIVKDTVEEKIIKLQNDKQKLAESVITEGDSIISRMTGQEILALFGE
jgi:superfamily II DNA or RNA helicase/predicted nucleic acid-binding Zn finger protein